MKLFNVVVPVFNEAKNISIFLKSFNSSEVSKHIEFGKLVIVNDGSTDETLKYLNEDNNLNKKIISYSKNIGYGHALYQGIKYSMKRSKYVVFIDSDLTNPIDDILKMIDKMNLDIDFIKGNRFHRQGGIELLPFNRRFFTKYGNFISRFLCNINIKDCTNGFRAVKTDLYENKIFIEKDFSVIMEEIYKLKNKFTSVSEIETTIGQRNLKQRGSSFNYNIKLIYKYFKYSFLSFFIKSNLK